MSSLRLAVGGLLALLLGAAFVRADQTVTVGPGISFSPSTVTIVPGETVTWTFAGVPHSTTSNATSGVDAWDSGIVFTTGATFAHTFSTAGSHPYYCLVHSSPTSTMMNGVVIVVPPTPTATPTPTPPPATATPAPSPTPLPGPAPSSGAVPDLTPAARLAFAALVAFAALAVLRGVRR